MPEPTLYELVQKLASIETKIDTLASLFDRHQTENDDITKRVRDLETSQTKLVAYATLAGTALSLAASKFFSLIKL